MNLYTLDDNFRFNQSVDIFNSLIWTERYSDAGDFQLVVPANPDLIALLSLETSLGLDDTDEIMTIDTQSIQNNSLTVTGKSLINFFGQRASRISYTSDLIDFPPADVIIEIVNYAVGLISGSYHGADEGLQAEDQLANFTCVNDDPDTTSESFSVSVGDLFSQVQGIASAYFKGIKLRITDKTDAGYNIVFTVYSGADRTSTQEDNLLVRFSPDTKSFVNTTELYSGSNYKNVCYAYASGIPTTVQIPGPLGDGSDDTTAIISLRMGVGALDDTALHSTGFNRRVVMVDYSDLSIDKYTIDVTTTAASLEASIEADLDIYAKNALLNYTFTKAVDGEVVPQSQYQYGRDYFLGDIIELQGASGLIQNARVTEYIRSQSSTGETAYPTVAVID